MTDYKRMISYMYQYEDGVKRRNVGYARVEAKNGQCKITLHMQLLGQLDSVFPTYLIHRGEGNTELIYLGDTMLKNQVMDSKLTADEANIMGSGYSLSEMGGLLLFLNDSIFFATEWDDKPIVAKDVLEAMKPKQKISKAPVAPDQKSVNRSDSVSQEVLQGKKQSVDEEAEETSETLNKQNSAFVPDYLENQLSLEEELKIPKYKFPRGWKTIERSQGPAAAQISSPYAETRETTGETVPESVSDIGETLQESITAQTEAGTGKAMEQEEMNYRQEGMRPEAENLYQGMEQQSDENQQLSYYEQPQDIMSEMNAEQEEMPTAKHFFDNYPRIYPFEDNEILLCVKIEPKDIGLLPKDVWALSNNSFLMHGFYCYHHLIFAKMKNDGGFIYILGIPGIFHNRERFMARMFGFENFKSIRKRDLRQGDFGYWYLPINF